MNKYGWTISVCFFCSLFLYMCLFVPLSISEEFSMISPLQHKTFFPLHAADDEDEYDPAIDFGCSLSTDAKILALSDLEGRVRIFDVVRKAEISRIRMPFEPRHGKNEYSIELPNPFRYAVIRLSPDGSRLAFLPIYLLPPGNFEEILVVGEGETMTAMYADENMRIFHPHQGAFRFVLPIASWMWVYDTTNGKLVNQFLIPPIAIQHNLDQVIPDQVISEDDWKDWNIAYAIEKSIKNPGIAYIDDTRRGIIAFSRSIASIRVSAGLGPEQFYFSSDSKKIFYAMAGSGHFIDIGDDLGIHMAACVEAETGGLLKLFQYSREKRSRSFSGSMAALLFDNDQKLVLGPYSREGQYAIFDTTSGKLINQFDKISIVHPSVIHQDGISNYGTFATAIDEGGKYLATANTGSKRFNPCQQAILIRNLWTGDVEGWLVPPDEKNSITCFQFSKNGKYLAAGTLHGNVYVWNVEQKTLVHWHTTNSPEQAATILQFGKNENELVVVFLKKRNISAEVVKWNFQDGKITDRWKIYW